MAAETWAAGPSKLKSIDPKDYQAQPELEPPAGYICVLRDVDTDRWRIEGARHPQRLIEDVLGASESRFGIEIVSILETEDLAASAAMLYERQHAELSETWLQLDEYQVEALRRSMLQIDAHASHYLKSTQARETPTAPTGGSAGRRSGRQRRDRWGLSRSTPLQRDRWGLGRGSSARLPLFRKYGAKSLKNYNEPEPRASGQSADDPVRLALNMAARFSKFRESNAGKALQVVLILLFVAITCVMDGCS